VSTADKDLLRDLRAVISLCDFGNREAGRISADVLVRVRDYLADLVENIEAAE
jgi:hypothetical protein